MAESDSSEIVKEMAESVAAANLKTIGDAPAFFTSLAMANAVAHQQGLNQVQTAVVAKSAQMIIEVSPSEGGADIAALQQLMKGAQTTPPVTA